MRLYLKPSKISGDKVEDSLWSGMIGAAIVVPAGTTIPSEKVKSFRATRDNVTVNGNKINGMFPVGAK